LGACELAPCMLANDDLHPNLDKQSATKFLDDLGCKNESKEAGTLRLPQSSLSPEMLATSRSRFSVP